MARDTTFDGTHLFSGGIRLTCNSIMPKVEDLREGVLLEAGFDTVTPNTAMDISSWAYDYAASKIEIIDNRAKAVPCYDPRYTFVETHAETRAACEKAYNATSALYYAGKPTLDEILVEIGKWTDRL